MTENILKGQNGEYFYFPDEVFTSKSGFSTIFLGKRIVDKKPVIIKKFKTVYKNDETEFLRFSNEAKFQFQNPNLVTAIDFFSQNNDFFLIRPYIEGIDLKNLIKTQRLSLGFAVKCGIKICETLEELHRNNLVHCDLKPANIIIEHFENQNFEIKIIDFGLTKKIAEEVSKLPFSLIYSSPEQVLRQYSLLNETSDIYSIAMILFEILTRKPPFFHRNPEILMNLQIAYPLKYHSKIPKNLFEILSKAAAKYRFLLPPNRFSKKELQEKLKLGQTLRFQNVQEFSQNLKLFLQENNKNLTFFRKLNNFFKNCRANFCLFCTQFLEKPPILY